MWKMFFSAVKIFVVAAICVLGVGCQETGGVPEAARYPDGMYRGAFIDGDTIQVNVQFTLENGVVTAARFRHLRRNDDYHQDAEEEPYRSVVDQYRESLDYLIGKDLRAHLADLYHPERTVITEVDGYSAATIRSTKIISAIRDGLNRGVYNY